MAQSESSESGRGTGNTDYHGYWSLYRLYIELTVLINSPVRTVRQSRVAGWVLKRFDGPTQSLVLATGLPLVDGVFPSLILSGTLGSVSGILVTAGTVFGGPWMLTIITSEMAGDPVSVRLRRVAWVSVLVIPAAALVAIIAPTVASLIAMDVFHIASAAVLFTVGSSIANNGLAARLPAPRIIVICGLLVSIGANLYAGGTVTPTLVVDPVLIIQATVTATAAFLLACGAAVIGPRLDDRLQIDRFRLGSGIALALVPLSLAGVIPSLASIAVFVLAGIFSLDNDAG